MRMPRIAALSVVLLGMPLAGVAGEADVRPSYAADPTVWPNAESFRNSDPWIAENHDRIRRLEPRVLVLNFANDVTPEAVREKTRKMIAALAESSRYHGYRDPDAPAVLRYQVLAYVDLRDAPPAAGREHKNGSRFPRRARRGGRGQNCDYGAFFSDAFTQLYRVEDPRRAGKLLSLEEMIQLGLVHELWFYSIHDEEGAPLETIEDKQYYDADLKPIPGKHGPAGNGHSDTLPWVGRSFRVTFFNPHRGIGCGLENFGHAMEGMAHYNFCPYFRKYFYEYAEFDLDAKYGLPFSSFYALPEVEGRKLKFLSPTSFEFHWKGQRKTFAGYQAVAGNVHFPPGASGDYDLESDATVMSTIEHYRLRDGEDGADRAEPWTKDRFARYRDLAPDCMGPWMVYWRQNMPGLGNRCRDDAGKPMKNWWVFLFY
ncbi:MAG: hypothetical protein JXP34_21350 [Planctomycetes bacterium]|nr:hypothetical protein [Planctomycetota bacterium]